MTSRTDRTLWASRRGPRTALRPQSSHVPVDKLLLGGYKQLTARDFAHAIDDLLWPSRRVLDGPHADLLKRSARHELDDAQILASAYATLARRCIALTGEYRSAVDEAGIVRVARDYIATAVGPRVPAIDPRGVGPGTPIRVARVRDSDCYQVVDGHHRVAARALAGEALVPVQVRHREVETPLQALVRRLGGGGQRELRQPIDAPELEHWPTVPGCEGRLAAMDRFLAGRRGLTHLDVASGHGWFIAGLGALGHRSEGVERDAMAPALGAAVHGLATRQVITADPIDFLGNTDRTWDVVSCFGPLHRVVPGRGAGGIGTLLRLLDRVTGSVLFLDTAQRGRGSTRSVDGWDAAAVQSFLAQETSFGRIIDLGPEPVDGPSSEARDGPNLIACVREN